MRKMSKMLAALLALIMTLTACGMAAAEQEVRKIETPADAEEWIRTLFGEHPEELDTSWALVPEAKEALAGAGGMKAVAMQLAAFGEVKEIQPVYQKEIQGYQFFYIPCVFSMMPVDIVLVTLAGAVAGIQTGAFSGQQEEEENTASSGPASIELNLPVPALEGELPGILTLPEGEGPFPAVVLVHGSGPNDMDETVYNIKPFKDLAEGLAAKGVAVYRYDKRTLVYGAEMAGNHQITLMDETVDDAAAAVQLLAAQDKIDSARIFVLGHSLGGNAIPAIAGVLKDQTVDGRGYIMMAASPRPQDELMREQVDFLYSLAPEITEKEQAEKDALFAELDKLKDLDSLGDDDIISSAYAPYWKWLAAYDILQAAKEIDKPVLLLQGEEDYQVTMTDFGIWQEAIGEKENWTLISYPGLIHLFITGQKAEGPNAYMKTEKVDEKVISDIAEFIEKNK
ncbi:MAG: alpha/beta fold hydrolase [Clostridia bacterium]|nr:alpha/beta fold hydrolase [Clostridia bacterium]